MDDLAAAFYRQGSIPAEDRDGKPVKPAALREAEAGGGEQAASEEEKAAAAAAEQAAAEQAAAAAAEAEAAAQAAAAEGDDGGEAAGGEEESAEGVEMVDMGDGNQIPLDELVKGHLRQSDYTKKTQELAEQRRALEDEKAGLLAQHAQAGAQLNELTQRL